MRVVVQSLTRRRLGQPGLERPATRPFEAAIAGVTDADRRIRAHELDRARDIARVDGAEITKNRISLELSLAMAWSVPG